MKEADISLKGVGKSTVQFKSVGNKHLLYIIWELAVYDLNVSFQPSVNLIKMLD